MPELLTLSAPEIAAPPGESLMVSPAAEIPDGEPIQSTDPEYIAAWWDVSMDAYQWWRNESITPIHAALILSGHNPNDGTEAGMIEVAERTTSGGIGPREFRALKNALECTSQDKPRTFMDWMEHAQQRGLKIHSWISEWIKASGVMLVPLPVLSAAGTPDDATEASIEPPGELLLVSPATAPAKPANNWDEHGLRRLLDENREPGMTQQKLAEKYGVTRQRIAALLKKATPKKADAFSTFVSGNRKK